MSDNNNLVTTSLSDTDLTLLTKKDAIGVLKSGRSLSYDSMPVTCSFCSFEADVPEIIEQSPAHVEQVFRAYLMGKAMEHDCGDYERTVDFQHELKRIDQNDTIDTKRFTDTGYDYVNISDLQYATKR